MKTTFPAWTITTDLSQLRVFLKTLIHDSVKLTIRRANVGIHLHRRLKQAEDRLNHYALSCYASWVIVLLL